MALACVGDEHGVLALTLRRRENRLSLLIGAESKSPCSNRIGARTRSAL